MDAAQPRSFTARHSAATLQLLEDLHALRRLEGSLDMLDAATDTRPQSAAYAALFSDVARRVFTR
jgi:hypothetical protein